MNAVAHVRVDESGANVPQLLEEHLQGTAKLAREFASAFGGEDWAELAGLWHDLGKYKPDFQEYIRERSGFERDEANEGGPGKVDHTAAGAIHAVNEMKMAGKILAYLIAGHHSGLPDWLKEDAPGSSLEERLQGKQHLEDARKGCIAQEILGAPLPKSAPCNKPLESDQLHLLIRMLFSCLVDADFLDTEAFMDPTKAEQRSAGLELHELRDRYNKFMDELSKAPDTLVNRQRRQILADCRKGAELEPGLFSLTVPTGGGKTLASMGFALDHAIRYGKRRVIVVIPYTSIIEQTAQVLRKVFGEHAVIEHHSNLDPDKETPQAKLASENWDAPIIVTTNVQLFESLFSARTSSCRKLHRIANSIVILDEAQMLPPVFLKPILSVLKGLVSNFGTSVVLCTATQPALEGRIGGAAAPHGAGGFIGLTGVRELMQNSETLSWQMRRVSLERHSNGVNPCSWNEIANELKSHDQVLCIVNTRKDCRELHGLMPNGTIHLSALMCGEHRSKVITEIKEKLKANESIRVISTQLVEAGVDLDFPVVYRAMAGLDSIAQAAGRCNREGLLDGLGKVIVFQPPKPAPIGLLRKGEDAGNEIFRIAPEAVAKLSPEAFKKYFEIFYSRVNSFDEKGIVNLLSGPDASLCQIQFRTAAMKFKLINDAAQKSILVWYKNDRFDSQNLIDKLRVTGPNRTLMRRLQRFTVNVPERCFTALRTQGVITDIKGPEGSLDIWAQCSSGLYDEAFGLRLDGPVYQGDEFIC